MLNLYVKAHQKITQCLIVAYLLLKGISTREIHDDIVSILGRDAVSYSSVTRYLRKAQFPPSKPEPHPADVQTDLDDSDQVILRALEDSPFASVRQLSLLAHLPSTTVYRRLTQSLGFVVRHIRWVSHALSDAQRGERVNLSRRLLRKLEVQRDQAWHDIITVDGSWFDQSTDYEFARLRRDEKAPERECYTIQSKKFIFTIVWNPCGFNLIKILEKGRKFKAGYCIADILEPLSQWHSIKAAGNERKLLVHVDSARPHTAKLSTQYFNENRTKSAPHPPSSPDLAPSDFYLLGDVKKCLGGLSFEDADQLLAAGEGVIEGI
jgi:hypothetical protein